MTHIWTERFSRNPGNPAFCREAVSDRENGGWYRNHQCTRKPVVQRVVNGAEYGFCKQHDPEAVAARGKARQEEWRLESERRNREYDRQKQAREAMEACKAAIEQIAAGHNDPRALAIATLELFP